MKKISIWSIIIFTLVMGFTSCEEIEEFENCPDVTINVDNVAGSAVYRFAAQLNGIEDVRLTWSIDGEEIDTGNLNDIAGQIFEYQFAEGTYTVCVKVASETCPIEVCKEIKVEIDETNPCPDLFFEAKQFERPNKYKFIADFSEIQEVRYDWFINGEFVEIDNQNEDNYLIWEFDAPGSYEVCVKSETPDCPNGTSYCKVIEIKEEDVDNQGCPDLFFIAEQDGDNSAYYFQAEFEGSNQLKWLGWFINGELVEDSNNGDNNRFYYQFEPGKYEVCLKTETPECPQGTSYCKIIEIEEKTICPELFFEAEQDGDNPAYTFYPSAFDGIENVTLDWLINGDFVGTSSGNNEPFYYQFAPGRYEVCLAVETPDCPQGTTFCKIIEVGEIDGSCPDLRFNRDGDVLFADFNQMNTIEWYGWYVNEELVENEGTINNGDNQLSLANLEPGTYTVCMMTETPECPRGTEYCKEIVIQ